MEKAPEVRHISRTIANKKIKEPQSGDTKFKGNKLYSIVDMSVCAIKGISHRLKPDSK